MKARFWAIFLDAVWAVAPRSRLWHWGFRYWDEAVGCGCWKY